MALHFWGEGLGLMDSLEIYTSLILGGNRKILIFFNQIKKKVFAKVFKMN